MTPDAVHVGLLTTGRQDWGILRCVAETLDARDDVALTVLVSGTHLLGEERAMTRVFDSGLRCHEIGMGSVLSPRDVTRPAALAAMSIELARAMDEDAIDVLMILGDRIETLQAAVTATAAGRQIAHIHGGDRAPGTYDEAARHAISKLAHLHLPATEAAAERLIRLGESPWRIHVVGSPAIDQAVAVDLPTGVEARRSVGLAGDGDYAVILVHPVAGDDSAQISVVTEVCQGVVDADLTALCLGPNADAGRDTIWETLQDFSRANNWPIHQTVARELFLALIRDAVALVGNSSAGMIESAAVGAVVIDVGDRQAGREHSANVVHVAPDAGSISRALRRIREDGEYARPLRSAPCVYGNGGAGEAIACVVARFDWSGASKIKRNEY